jgi:hypothetical protein
VGLFPITSRDEPGVDRNEGGREDSFTKEILQKVGDLERRVERVGGVRGAEVVGEGPVSDQSKDPAE